MEKQEHRKIGVHTNKYVASFVGVTPVKDPKLVVLVVMYDPKGEGGHGGGRCCRTSCI